MGAVSYGQAGYVGTSMSVRARAAYESGEMPMSKWTRGAIISAIKDYCDDFDLAYDSKIESMTRAQLADRYLEYKSWHHTGRFARGTDFSDWMRMRSARPSPRWDQIKLPSEMRLE